MLLGSLSLVRAEPLALASVLALLVFSWPSESHAALTSPTNTPASGTIALEEKRIRRVIHRVMGSVDARRWETLRDLCTDTVFVDYTSLFGGQPRNYTVVDLIDNWRQLLTPFSSTRHDLGPIDVEIAAGEAKAWCPVHIHHFLHGAPGGEEWIVNGEYMVTLKRLHGSWQIQQIVFAVQSQEGNTNLLLEALAAADGQ